MLLRLYTRTPPRGRCLLLARGLHAVAGGDPMASLGLAERLFDGQFTEQAPTEVEVADPAAVEALGCSAKSPASFWKLAAPDRGRPSSRGRDRRVGHGHTRDGQGSENPGHASPRRRRGRGLAVELPVGIKQARGQLDPQRLSPWTPAEWSRQ